MISLIVAPNDCSGKWFEQTSICPMSGSFHVNLNSPCSVVLDIFKDFSYKLYIKYCIPYRDPTQSPGAVIWTNYNLPYVKKLQCNFSDWKSQTFCGLIWPQGPWFVQIWICTTVPTDPKRKRTQSKSRVHFLGSLLHNRTVNQCYLKLIG